MGKISKECIDEALKALKDFNKEELNQYVRDVFEKSKEFKGMSNMRAFEQAMTEINNQKLQSYFESCVTAANNVQKIDYLSDRIKKGKATLMNISVKVGKGDKSNNVAAAQKASHEELDNVFFSKIDEPTQRYFESGENDLVIADALDERQVESKEAKNIARLIKEEYIPFRNTEIVTSNAMPFDHINQDRNFRNIHDPQKILMGGRSGIDEAYSHQKFDMLPAKRKWIDTIKKHFDLIHSDAVDIDGKVDNARVDEIIGGMYDNITTGKSDLFTRSIVVNDKVQVQNRSRRRLQPKSWRDFVEYNKEYGRGNLFDALIWDIKGSANKIGMARILGDSPHAAFLDLKKVQQEVNPNYGALKFHQAELNFKEVTGENKVAQSMTLAQFGANTRTLSSMARLPLVAIQSIPDINHQAIFAMNHGYSYWKAWGYHLKNIFDLYPDEERKFLADIYSNMFKHQMGHIGRLADESNLSDRLNKISTAYFRLNLLERFDRGNKMSAIYLVSRGLANKSHLKYENLPSSTKNFLSKFIEPEEWNLLKEKNTKNLFTIDNIEKLSNDELKYLHKETGNLRPFHEYRNDLYRKVHAMSQIAVENTILQPGEFEKAFLLQGTKPGTPVGEAMRFLTHFKGFSIQNIDKNLLQGYHDADKAGHKIAWATAQLIGAIPLSLMGTFLYNIARGKSMPDPSRMNMGEKIKFFLELSQPGLALFSGVLDPKHQNADGVLSLLFSPSLRLIGNALAAPFAMTSALYNGDPKKFMKAFMNVAKYAAPLQTLPIISPFLNEIMGQESHLEPGQTQIYGK